jgi:hypothetical protein
MVMQVKTCRAQVTGWRLWACGTATAVLLAGFGAYAEQSDRRTKGAVPPGEDYCTIQDRAEMIRPAANEPVIDDVNWFARPVPNPQGHWIVGFASHNENYLYDLTTGRRVRIPDRSDAVATPDGRYMTVPSHYTATNTINFYDLPTLLERLEKGQSAADVAPVFAHKDPDVHDVFYQSTGVVSTARRDDAETIVYRMMFSGSREPAPPGFRIVDYTFTRAGGKVTVQASPAMRLCPQIVNDMATPFISKDGRYVVAHDGQAGRASLKIFEIAELHQAEQTTTCRPVVDFGFVAGKADFNFDNTQLTFHVATHDYLTAFVDGGLRTPVMTDVMVVDLPRDATGAITGHRGLTRLTLSRTPGVGSYFPAFFPDGRIVYVFNAVPKDGAGPKRFQFKVVDPAQGRRVSEMLTRRDQRESTAAIGELWRTSCLPASKPLDAREAAWYVASLSKAQCRRLVEDGGPAAILDKTALLALCDGL